MLRATYVGSTDWMWPWSFDKCDRSLQPKQEINACEPNPHFGLHSKEGRGAPEIDLLEAMPGSGTLGYGLKKPYFSASYQVAPGKPHDRPIEGKKPRKGQWYEKGLEYGKNATVNAFFYGEELSHKTKTGYVRRGRGVGKPPHHGRPLPELPHLQTRVVDDGRPQAPVLVPGRRKSVPHAARSVGADGREDARRAHAHPAEYGCFLYMGLPGTLPAGLRVHVLRLPRVLARSGLLVRHARRSLCDAAGFL